MTLPHFPSDAGEQPSLDFADYRSTALRHPSQPLIVLPQRLTEVTGPLLGEGRVKDSDSDLTRQHDGEALGQRIIVTGRVLDANRKPVPNTLVEIWQANAAGRYRHTGDNWPAPLDPNFDGVGRAMTDAEGRYTFLTVKPGAYPWKNHDNAWRPAHIHFSLFGRSFTQRLVTQMYFPDDPLFFQDPIFNAVRDEQVRNRMIATYNHGLTSAEWALGFEWDIVLRGADRSYFEEEEDDDDV
ncbi:protocatechuate 3,4-dioxygenase subunit beta [Epidermidibacterium keratini]|uniref:Protocatechuate 3,4-dioxygenase subunit beta n=1 Tax=Epidermidibacterium keratini TaxID=1891644 RepID=A0A7L4YP06_9ACTN|nr:protocatechuate 3,4-dioxygenase subunit beta [Epidermidibacterium keratini]QHC00808.1 protocatechuate 3,4-dioxygenase subunit beta [Epidermidibacterium keratini]